MGLHPHAAIPAGDARGEQSVGGVDYGGEVAKSYKVRSLHRHKVAHAPGATRRRNYPIFLKNGQEPTRPSLPDGSSPSRISCSPGISVMRLKHLSSIR